MVACNFRIMLHNIYSRGWISSDNDFLNGKNESLFLFTGEWCWMVSPYHFDGNSRMMHVGKPAHISFYFATMKGGVLSFTKKRPLWSIKH